MDEWFCCQPSMVATLIRSTLRRLLQNLGTRNGIRYHYIKWRSLIIQRQLWFQEGVQLHRPIYMYIPLQNRFMERTSQLP